MSLSKKIQSKNWVIAGLMLVAAAMVAQDASAASGGSARMRKRIGIYGGGLFISEPSPAQYAGSVGFNVTDFMRLHSGFGYTPYSDGDVTASVMLYGGGINFMIPGWNFTPTVGFNVYQMSVSGTISTSAGLFDFSQLASGTILSIPFGLEWQTPVGFYISAGATVFLAPSLLSSLVPLAPSANIGWFF